MLDGRMVLSSKSLNNAPVAMVHSSGTYLAWHWVCVMRGALV